MSFRRDGEQEELQQNATRIKTKIIQDVKRNKHRNRTVEHSIINQSGLAKRVIAHYDKKGKVVKEYFEGSIMNRIETIGTTRKEKRQLMKAIKAFIKKNPRVRLTEFGLRKLVIDDILENIPDENL